MTSGSTWHAAGLITAYHPAPNVKRVHWESLNFYNQITAETGQEIGFHRPGSLRLGTSPARMDEFRYTLSRQGHKQSPMQLLTEDQVAEMVPILNMDKVSQSALPPPLAGLTCTSLARSTAVSSLLTRDTLTRTASPWLWPGAPGREAPGWSRTAP